MLATENNLLGYEMPIYMVVISMVWTLIAGYYGGVIHFLPRCAAILRSIREKLSHAEHMRFLRHRDLIGQAIRRGVNPIIPDRELLNCFRSHFRDPSWESIESPDGLSDIEHARATASLALCEVNAYFGPDSNKITRRLINNQEHLLKAMKTIIDEKRMDMMTPFYRVLNLCPEVLISNSSATVCEDIVQSIADYADSEMDARRQAHLMLALASISDASLGFILPKESDDYLAEAHRIAAGINDLSILRTVLLFRSTHLAWQGKHVASKEIDLESLRLLTLQYNQHVGSIHNNLCDTYTSSAEYLKASEAFTDGLKHLGKLNDQSRISALYSNHSNVLFRLRKFRTSMLYMQQALAVNSTLTDSEKGIAIVLLNTSHTLIEHGKFIEALNILSQAGSQLNNREQSSDTLFYQGRVASAQARAHYEMQSYTQSLELANLAITAGEETGDIVQIAYTAYNASEASYCSEQYDLAKVHLSTAKSFFSKEGRESDYIGCMLISSLIALEEQELEQAISDVYEAIKLVALDYCDETDRKTNIAYICILAGVCMQVAGREGRLMEALMLYGLRSISESSVTARSPVVREVTRKYCKSTGMIIRRAAAKVWYFHPLNLMVPANDDDAIRVVQDELAEIKVQNPPEIE